MREVRDFSYALARAGRAPDTWSATQWRAEVADTPIPAEERAVETWLRFTLPAGTRAFELSLHHLPTHVWIDDVEVTVGYDDGTLGLVHAVPQAATLTLRCLRARDHVGPAALRSPLYVDLT